MADHDSGEQQNPSEIPKKPYWIHLSVRGFERYRNLRRTEKDHESAADRSSRSTARATWAIAILTLVTIGVGVSQYIIFGRQLDEMRATRADSGKAMDDQMAIMRDQAKAMQGQLDQLDIAQRPWIQLVKAEPGLKDVENKRMDWIALQYAGRSMILGKEKAEEMRQADLAEPLFTSFTVVGCITYTYRNGNALGQTPFILDVYRPCPESPVGQCLFNVSHINRYTGQAMMVTEIRRGLFAK